MSIRELRVPGRHLFFEFDVTRQICKVDTLFTYVVTSEGGGRGEVPRLRFFIELESKVIF